VFSRSARVRTSSHPVVLDRVVHDDVVELEIEHGQEDVCDVVGVVGVRADRRRSRWRWDSGTCTFEKRPLAVAEKHDQDRYQQRLGS
jgi:hypothetical protein